MSKIQWVPLESNPEVMNKCLQDLGVPANWGVADVLSLDEEFISMVPKPTLAVLLLFPITPKYVEQYENLENMQEKGVVEGAYFMKQTVKNACGTIALIHAIANNEDVLDLKPDSPIKKFLNSTRNLTPEERGKALEENMDISTAHEASAAEGQTEAPSADEDVYLHYIAIMNMDQKLVEFDGRKSGPIVHGASSQESFVQDAFKLCRAFMDREPGNLNFTVLAFGRL